MTLFEKGPLSSVKFDDVEKLKYFLLSRIKKEHFDYLFYLVCSEKEVRCERADPYGGRYHALPPTPESHPASPDSGCPAHDTVKEEEEEEEEGDLVVHLYQGEPAELETQARSSLYSGWGDGREEVA